MSVADKNVPKGIPFGTQACMHTTRSAGFPSVSLLRSIAARRAVAIEKNTPFLQKLDSFKNEYPQAALPVPKGMPFGTSRAHEARLDWGT